MNNQIVREFPAPTRLLTSAFADLQIARSDDDEARQALGDLSALARPWDPASCPPTLREELWIWLDRVVGWINHDYSWQHDRVIPACWPAHPHIVHDVAVIACLRYSAGHALTADPLEDWHRYALPAFFDRMTARLGGSPCPPGEHKPWPARGRFSDYESEGALRRRMDTYAKDTGRRGNTNPPPPARNGRAALTAVGPADPADGR